MSAIDTKFVGSIPAIYDEHLGPLVFQPYADDLVGRLRDLTEGVLLEIAAGTGVVTRALAAALPPAVRIIATDLNEAMLKVAAGRSSTPSVTWQPADAQRLPFADAEMDAVVCQFGIMFVPDKVVAYREARRVLKPAGRFVFNIWDGLAQNEVARILAETLASVFPDDPPRFIERTPHGHGDPAVIRRELETAGFRGIEIEAVEKVTRAVSPEHTAIGYCKGTPVRSEIEARAPARLDEITGRVRDALAARFGSSSFENRMRAYVITAEG